MATFKNGPTFFSGSISAHVEPDAVAVRGVVSEPEVSTTSGNVTYPGDFVEPGVRGIPQTRRSGVLTIEYSIDREDDLYQIWVTDEWGDPFTEIEHGVDEWKGDPAHTTGLLTSVLEEVLRRMEGL